MGISRSIIVVTLMMAYCGIDNSIYAEDDQKPIREIVVSYPSFRLAPGEKIICATMKFTSGNISYVYASPGWTNSFIGRQPNCTYRCYSPHK